MTNIIKKHNMFMRISLLTAIAIAVISCGTSPSNTSQASTVTSSQVRTESSSRQSNYMANLRELGYTPEINVDGDIQFNGQTYTYIITIREDKPEYTVLWIPLYIIDSIDTRNRSTQAALKVNKNVLVARSYILDLGDVELFAIAADVYLKDPNSFMILFPRLLRSVDEAWETINS